MNCQSTNVKGLPCSAHASDTGYCFMHDPTKGHTRALARRNGGLKSKMPHYADASKLPEVTVIGDVVTLLNYTLVEAAGLDNSIARGRLLVAIAHGYIEAFKVGELQTRMEAVEMALALRK